MPLLFAQRDAARGAEVARMKSEGIPYEERIAQLDGVTWPQPQRELIDACFATYRTHHPWVESEPSPKSIVREMLESGDSFGGYVHRYKTQRSEGLLLRYLTDAWRALDRSLPDDAYTEMVEDVVDWLGALIRATDASLLDEWTRLAGAPVHDHVAVSAPAAGPAGPPAAWKTAVRTAAFGWVQLLAARRYPALAERTGWDGPRLAEAMTPYWAEHDAVAIDADARSAEWFVLSEEPARWVDRQQFADGEWYFTAEVDLAAALDAGAPTLRLLTLGPFA